MHRVEERSSASTPPAEKQTPTCRMQATTRRCLQDPCCGERVRGIADPSVARRPALLRSWACSKVIRKCIAVIGQSHMLTVLKRGIPRSAISCEISRQKDLSSLLRRRRIKYDWALCQKPRRLIVASVRHRSQIMKIVENASG
jgi:hypothetical protein